MFQRILTMMIPAVIAIENHATQLLQAHRRIRSIRKNRTREATFDALVLKPFR
jgi:hypothetical protein